MADDSSVTSDAPAETSDEIRRKRVFFRSQHRGTKEIDLVLGNFAAENLAGFSTAELDDYEILIEENDADLWDWMIARSDPPKHLQTAILHRLQMFRLVKLSGGQSKDHA